jgi:N-formylglutamate deformylase
VDKYYFYQGSTPLLIGMPHVGTHLPEEIATTMTEAALDLPDTDWHVDTLYDFLYEIGASVISATHSRYVIDLNRPPDGTSLYPGHDVTELCPTTTFDNDPIYFEGQDPDDNEIATRLERYWHPYHHRLAEALAELTGQYGYALLWDAHSIRSVVPRFFEGKLADLNLGNSDGNASDSGLAHNLLKIAQNTPDYTAVLNGRFKGGYITRTYGQPKAHIHAVQLEQSQATYMEESPPFTFREDLAEQVRPVLRRLIETMLAWRPAN